MIPRRICLEKMCPAEVAILNATRTIEDMAADERLSRAQALLSQARDLVADYIDIAAIDWTLFDQYPENTNECRCGSVFRSHTKATSVGTFILIISRKPCPYCGKNDTIRASRGEPEEVTIRGKP